MALSAIEVRVLGSLVEKERTTPEGYPLSSQGLMTACNQKTSREPVTSYHLQEVLAALQRLRDRGLAATVHAAGERVPKHRHRLVEALDVRGAEVALLAVLMLRGPQTPGELRSRTDRYLQFKDIDEVEAVLERLASRSVPLVKNLGRSPGQSQDRWMHTLGQDDEKLLPRVRAVRVEAPAGPAGEGRPGDAAMKGPDLRLLERLESLERRVALLEALVDPKSGA